MTRPCLLDVRGATIEICDKLNPGWREFFACPLKKELSIFIVGWLDTAARMYPVVGLPVWLWTTERVGVEIEEAHRLWAYDLETDKVDSFSVAIPNPNRDLRDVRLAIADQRSLEDGLPIFDRSRAVRLPYEDSAGDRSPGSEKRAERGSNAYQEVCEAHRKGGLLPALHASLTLVTAAAEGAA